jgi:O-antigen/teichoic acid export membrane protein
VLPALQGLVVPDAYRGPFETYSVALMPGLFCLSMMFYALNPVFQIRRRTVPVIAAALVGLAVNGAGLLVLPDRAGGIGVALAQTLGLAAAALWLGWRALTGAERIRLPWAEIGVAALACAAMGLALAPFRHLPPVTALAVLVPAGMALYGALVWIFDIAGLRRQVLARLRPARAMAAE